MKQIFTKEWQQGRMIALFGLLMGGLVVALWAVLTLTYGHRNWADQEAVNTFCGVMYYIVPVLLAIFVGSGLFSAEVERGTLPLLLALPFNRRQVWLGKMVAGLALMTSAVVMVIVPGAIAAPVALASVSYLTYLPDLLFGCGVLFLVATMWSALSNSVVHAFLSTIALGVVIFLNATLMLVLGGRLLGPPLLDVELWVLFTTPALMFGSYFAFVHGDLFRPKRRWFRPALFTLCVYLITFVAVVMLVRWDTRYERTKIEQFDNVKVTGGGQYAVIRAYGSKVNLLHEAARKPVGSAQDWRRNYSVVLGLTTGKKPLVGRETGLPEVSPNGKYAAMLAAPPTLTWRGETRWSGRVLEVWDLKQHCRIYRGVPTVSSPEGSYEVGDIIWSPDSKWLGLTGPERDRITFMRSNGTGAYTIETYSTYSIDPMAFAPSANLAYTVSEDDKGIALWRHDLNNKRASAIWRTARKSSMESLKIAVSPNGKQLALVLRAMPDRQEQQTTSQQYVGEEQIFVISSDGSRARQVVQRSWTSKYQESVLAGGRLVWRPDSNGFMYLTSSYRNETWYTRMLRWKEDEQPVVSTYQSRERDRKLTTGSDGSTLFATKAGAYLIGSNGVVKKLADTVAATLMDANSLVGLDTEGRAIIIRYAQDRDQLAALNLTTGEVTKIYP